jgi:hypothetical protein
VKNLLCLAALLIAGTATAGPIRDRIAARWESRLGVIFPHRVAPSCNGACPACPSCVSCPGGSCPLPAAGVVARPVAPVYQPAPQTIRYVQVCENGKCRLVPVRE